MKKVLSLLLCAVLMLGTAACGGRTETTEQPSESERSSWDASKAGEFVEAAVSSSVGKICIVTNSRSGNEEAYLAAEAMAGRYSGRVAHITLPDSAQTEEEAYTDAICACGTESEVKVLILNEAGPASDAAVDKLREIRSSEELLLIYCDPQESTAEAAGRADLLLAADKVKLGGAIARQAFDMGCGTLVHYGFSSRKDTAAEAACRKLMKETCEALGLRYTEAEIPDPSGSAGMSGAQAFILDDVPKKVKTYGQNTAFFINSCSMQVPLIKAAAAAGAYYPLPCCPGPYHGFPSAFGIACPEDPVKGLPDMIAAIDTKLKEESLGGHFAAWRVPETVANIAAAAEYGFLWMAGTVSAADPGLISALLSDYCGCRVEAEMYSDPKDGNRFGNCIVYLQEILTFGKSGS